MKTAKPTPIDREVDEEVKEALKWLKSHSDQATLEGMARYVIPSTHAMGVAMRDVKALGTQLGTNQDHNWAFYDAMSFNLFDRTPHAWAKVHKWSLGNE